MKKTKEKQQRLPGVIDEIQDIRKIIAEGRDEVQGDIESLRSKIRNCGDLIEAKQEREEELNDALRKLDHLQTLKDRLGRMLDKELDKIHGMDETGADLKVGKKKKKEKIDPEAGKKEKKDKKEKKKK